MTRLRSALAPLSVLLLAACTAAGGAPAASTPSAERLEPQVEELRRDVFAFAADSFRGRETGTPDADRAARWLARRLAAMGVEPGGDSGYFHRVPMRRTETSAKELRVGTPSGARTLTLWRDIAFLAAFGPGALPRLTADGDVVFASYGIRDTTLARDDFAGLDLKGKVVVIAGVVPPGVDSARRVQMSSANAIFSRIGPVIGQQPAAIVLLLPDSLYQLAVGQFESQVELGSEATAPQNRAFPMVGIAPLSTGSPFLPAGWPASDVSLALQGTRFTAQLDITTSSFNGYNVVGVVPGSDAALRGTYVAYGAHYDHIGIQSPVNGDSIANGADDDASGSVTLLAIARAWMEGPRPKRSGLFVWHVGEEKGLFGSQVFAESGPIPADSIVAQINADMIGRNHPDSIYVVGPAAAPKGQSAVVGTMLDSVNAALPRPFVFNREWDSTRHPEQIYFRSDHFNYARKGIPILFLTTGLHEQYHQVTDEAALIDVQKLARVGSLMYRVGIALGNRPDRPLPTAVQ